LPGHNRKANAKRRVCRKGKAASAITTDDDASASSHDAAGSTTKLQAWSVFLKHRDVEYSVEEDQPGLWRWTIFPKIENGPKIVGEFRTREVAVAACIEEINNSIARVRLRTQRP
jgi:hypothetical protein